MKKKNPLFCFIVCLFFLVGCGGGGGGSGGGDASPPANSPPGHSSVQKPAPPKIISVKPGDGQVILKWVFVSGVDSYNIYWDKVPGVNKSSGIKISGARSPYAHKWLTNGVKYYYVATSVNGFGESEESNEVSARPSKEIPTVISFESPEQAYVNTEFSVLVKASSVEDIFGVNFDLIYNPNLLKFVNVVEEDFFSIDSQTIMLFNANTPGQIIFSVNRLGANSGSVQGSGNVATFMFEPKDQIGSVALTFKKNAFCVLESDKSFRFDQKGQWEDCYVSIVK